VVEPFNDSSMLGCMNSRIRTLCGLALAALGLLACGSHESEPDTALTRYEFEVSASSEKAGAIVEVDTGVMAVMGSRLVYVPKGAGAAPVVIQEAPRLYNDLTTDENYVYYATQQPGRISHFEPRSETGGGGEPDGYIYRVSKRPPFVPEVVTSVGILAGRFESRAGHLYACESPGGNGPGSVVDVPLATPQATKHRSFRFNEFCRSVVADDAKLYLVMDRSRMSASGGQTFEKTVVLSTAPRDADSPWNSAQGPTILHVTDDQRISGYALYLRSDRPGLALVARAGAKLFKRDGSPDGTFRIDTRGIGETLVPDGAGWLWSHDADGGRDRGRACTNGRLYAGAFGTAGQELTQNVCAVDAIASGPSGVWFVAHAEITPGGPGTEKYRFRLKLVPRPKP
jgi:hypothetical protein